MSLTAKRRVAAATGSKRVDAARLRALAARVTTTFDEHDELEIENPATGRLLATVPRCTGADVELALQRARVAQQSWAQTDWATREGLLMRVHDMVLERQDELLDVIQLESGKARR